MATRTTRWSPDTCGCVVEYTWDDSVPDAARVHTPAAVVAKCPVHAALNDGGVHAALLDENPRKNKALDAIHKTLGSKVSKKDADGNDVLDESKVKWAFDANRDLELDLGSAAKKDKDDALTAAQAAVGSKVKVK